MIPDIKLNDGRQISQIGLGLWKVKDEAEFNRSFQTAVAARYTHFDTAQAYGNEQFLGAAWQRAGLKRDKFWITTKISVDHMATGRSAASFQDSLNRLQTDYVDLLLLHFPVSLVRKKAWKALEAIKAAGGARSIGVSNYTIKHLEQLQEYAKELPAVNQVELHVFLQQPELVEYCRKHDIIIEAYSPLAHAREMSEPVIVEIAKKYGKTYAQVMLRWCVQQGFVVLPKSVTPERVQQNIDIFDFELGPEDMQKLAALDRDLRTAWDPTHVP
jgi:diketogulonate reductase-like aldo/keto reductase